MNSEQEKILNEINQHIQDMLKCLFNLNKSTNDIDQEKAIDLTERAVGVFKESNLTILREAFK